MDYFLSFLSGILFFLSFPKFDFSIFSWIAFVPLIYTLLNIFYFSSRQNLKRVVVCSLITGITGYFGVLYWIIPTFKQAGENIFWGLISTFLLSLYCSLYILIFSIYEYKNKTILSSSILWIILEYVREKLFSGFPWALLGYSQWKNLPLIQISEIFGVYVISFLIIFFNLSLGFFIFELFKLKKIKNSTFINLLLIFIVIIALNIWGKFRIQQIKKEIENQKESFTVVILQGNIDQYKKWDKNYVEEIIEKYTNLVYSSFNEIEKIKTLPKLTLWIWPESSIPGFLFEEQKLFNWIKELLIFTNKKLISYHLLGTVRTDYNDNLYNSAVLVSFKEKDVIVENIYDKIQLVPFGEFVPLQNILGKFINVVNQLGGFSSGNSYTVFEIPLENSKNNFKFSVLICYESIFSKLTTNFVKNKAEFLVNITNDAWFLKTSAPHQHFSFNVFRAIENRVYVFRSANTGISAVISPVGEIEKQTNLFEYDKIVYPVKFYYEKTFYTKCANYFQILYILIFIFLHFRRKNYACNNNRDVGRKK
jgi:apolipoprotein N-acyltransferase